FQNLFSLMDISERRNYSSHCINYSITTACGKSSDKKGERHVRQGMGQGTVLCLTMFPSTWLTRHRTVPCLILLHRITFFVIVLVISIREAVY
ncbi:MAG: hypothetical protein PHG48_06910, partial [Eubacteriales bacterium]|nr:hypothetical protein [Eubacteriales bacterium]